MQGGAKLYARRTGSAGLKIRENIGHSQWRVLTLKFITCSSVTIILQSAEPYSRLKTLEDFWFGLDRYIPRICINYTIPSKTEQIQAILPTKCHGASSQGIVVWSEFFSHRPAWNRPLTTWKTCEVQCGREEWHLHGCHCKRIGLPVGPNLQYVCLDSLRASHNCHSRLCLALFITSSSLVCQRTRKHLSLVIVTVRDLEYSIH